MPMKTRTFFRPSRGRSRSRTGVTLVEILVVGALATVIIGGLVMLMTGYRRSFAKGEESTVVLQEAGLFLGFLRNDLINAVRPPTLPPDRWRESIVATRDKLTLSIFRDADGNIDQVTYAIEGNSIKRSQSSGRSKTIVDGRLASLSWTVGSEELAAPASGVKRIWVELQGGLGGQGRPGTKSMAVPIRTRLFPTRLNRQLSPLP